MSEAGNGDAGGIQNYLKFEVQSKLDERYWDVRDEKLPVKSIVPRHLKSTIDTDDVIFGPTLVSIGPFHHGKFPAMEEHKRRILKSIIARSDPGLLIWLDAAMKAMETDTRSFYSETFPEIDFPKMMVLDGCFILHMFRMTCPDPNMTNENDVDPISKTRYMLPVIAMDMVKLENQLPYFVLEKLYDMTKIGDGSSLNLLAFIFLENLRPGVVTPFMLPQFPSVSPNHLLALFYSLFATNVNPEKNNACSTSISIDDKGKSNSFPSVTDLCLSGIKVVGKTSEKRLTAISYNSGRLEIPTLVVDHSTNILMRNLIAYEQCNSTVPDNFISYVTFMDALVNSAEDVEVLRVKGVIDHFMNSNEEVSKLLNNLTNNIRFDMNKGYLAELNEQVYRDHYSWWPQLKARFKRLVNSREGIAYIVTIAALYLTILQTVFTVLAYVYPKPS